MGASRLRFCFSVSTNALSLFKISAAFIAVVNTSNTIWLVMVTPASVKNPGVLSAHFPAIYPGKLPAKPVTVEAMNDAFAKPPEMPAQGSDERSRR